MLQCALRNNMVQHRLFHTTMYIHVRILIGYCTFVGLTKVKDTIPDTFRGSDHCFVWYAGLEEADPLKSDSGKQNKRYGVLNLITLACS